MVSVFYESHAGVHRIAPDSQVVVKDQGGSHAIEE
jgi:hypothetical protein